jgi:small subunit ribosomal protein S15
VTALRQTKFVFGYDNIPELHRDSVGDVKNLFDLKFASQREVNKVAIHQMMSRLQKEPSDTGSTDVQVGVLTVRIQYLTEHMKVHRKDFSCKRRLQMLVDKRKKLLKYLKRTNLERYHEIIKDLGIRPLVETKYPK